MNNLDNQNSENLPPVVDDLKEPVNRFIQNPIAAWVVKGLKKTRVTPNQVTYTSIVSGLISGYVFSHGTVLAMVHGGFFLLLTLILDCVDGQLARAKDCASDWGRLLDGIAGYIAYPAAAGGIMIGFPEHRAELWIIGIVTILKAISYDYCKLSMTTMIQKGYDGNQKEILRIYQKIKDQPSAILKLYFYYLQFQQFIFRGNWNSFAAYEENEAHFFNETVLTTEQRAQYQRKMKSLRVVWSWNGVDLPLFLLAVFSITGILLIALVPLAWVLTIQYIVTMFYHLIRVRGLEKRTIREWTRNP